VSGVKIYGRAVAMLAVEGWLVPILALANAAVALLALVEPILFGKVIDALVRGDGATRLIWIWAGFGLAGILAGVLVAVASDRMAHRLRLKAMADAFERAVGLPVGFHAERGSGAIVRTILSGTDALFWTWLGLLREQLSALVCILFLVPTAIAMDARMAAILGGLALAFVLLNVLVVHKTGAGQAAVERHHGTVFGRVGDVIGNVTVVQSYARIAAEMEAMRGLMAQLLAAQYPVLTWWGLLTVLTRAAGTITMLSVFGLGAFLAERGEITVGEIVSFVGFAGLLIGKLDQLSGFTVRLFQQAPTLGSLFALLDQQELVLEAPSASVLPPVEGRVQFEGVTFVHGPNAPGVYDLNFEVAPGETIAIVGPTGAGKTTALMLLQRLRPLGRGRIAVDGIDISEVTIASLRASIAVVFQDAGLFNRSIADNIRIGRPSATDAEVEAAARLAEAHDFIVKRPGGYGFVIGERGNALSGGERQCLAIARAVLKDAPILILDEATSALDSVTEARIKRALDKLRQGRTTFIIAHRLSTVADADRILVLDHGRIVEDGGFRDLAAAGGLFSQLVAEGGFLEPVPTPP
jgi:glucan exporter ATP-binding protein